MSMPEDNLDKGYARTAVRRSFDRAADSYDDYAVLQVEVAERLLERLDVVRMRPRTIIDVGCGTGYCTRALERRYKGARVIGVDLAPKMAQTAARRRGFFSRSRFLCGDAEQLPLANGMADMIISNLAFQWCDPMRVFAEMRRLLAPGGVLLFTSFGPDTLHELRAAWRATDGGTHVHHFVDMHDLGDALVHTGFAEPVMDASMIRMDYGDVSGMLRDLKGIGANNVDDGRRRGLLGKEAFTRFRQAYEAMAIDGKIPASYEVVFGTAWAPTTARPADGVAGVPLEAIGGRRRRRLG